MGNYTRTMKWILCFVFVAAAIAATPSEEPYLEPATDELIQTGKASAHQMNTEAANDINPKKTGTGRFKKTANFPGAPYGLPGDKESPDWVNDVDIYNPLVFNWQFYAAMYGLKGKTEAEVRTDWANVALKADAKSPGCRQGNKDFSIDRYYRANAGLQEGTGGLCRKLLTQYLKDGIFAGLKKEDPAEEARRQAKATIEAWRAGLKGNAKAVMFRGMPGNSHNKREWVLRRGGANFGRTKFVGVKSFTITYWLKISSLMKPWTNIMHYGNSNSERSPGMWVYPWNRGRVHFRQSMAHNWNWGCDPGARPFDHRNRWVHVGYVTSVQANGNGAVEIFYDGKSVAKCNSPSKTTIRSQRVFWVTDPWYHASRGTIRDLTFYNGAAFTPELIAAEHAVGKAALGNREGEELTLVLKD